MKWDFNTNVDPYYKYKLFYVDDFLHIGFNPKEDMDALNLIYQSNEGFGPHDQYICANVEELQLGDGLFVCSTNRVDYLKRSIETFNNSLGVYNTEINNYGDGHWTY